MAFPFAEQGDQHVGTGHLVAAGALHVDGGALDHALESGGGLRVPRAFGGQAGQVLVQELAQLGPQLVEVDPTGAQHGRGVGVVGQAEQQVLQRGIFVAALAGDRQGAVQRLF